MSNQTFILVCLVLCSLGGWYVVLTKYFELKSMMQDLETEQPVAQTNYNGRHIPGMGAPPPYNIPFNIPPQIYAEVNNPKRIAAEQEEEKEQEEEEKTSEHVDAVVAPKANHINAQTKRLICNWAGMLHLSGFILVLGVPFLNILLPTALWLWKKEEHPFLDKNGREVINFQITYTFIQFLCLSLGTLFIYFAPNLAISLFNLIKPWRIVFTTGMHLPFNIFTIVPFFWACVVMLRGIVSALHGLTYKYPIAQDFIAAPQPARAT